MKVLVIGAGGKTGSEAITHALRAGHEVTAFVHKAAEYNAPADVRVVEGDATDSGKMAEAVRGQDAVLDTLGGHTPYKQTTLETSAARTIVQAMKASGVRRLIVTSMLGEGDSKANTSFFYEHLLIPTFLHGAAPDKAGMEAEVEESGLDWIILRPAVLTDGEATGNIRVFTPESGGKAHKISRADVANFMVEQLASDTYLRQAVTIATS